MKSGSARNSLYILRSAHCFVLGITLTLVIDRSVQLTIDTPNFQFLMVIRLSISTEVEFQVMVKITQLKQSQDKNCLSYLHKVKVDS